ncbi:hypothetical protein D210916BOD24_22070 [Alteromonas sp. D210916BOD_24]|uniref:putative 2OG-Fe(II) oxygenase n=1 Tax=Alteromonas sp. D210916BOD_24 TaxID=3157618 RepID=UPI00399C865B
MKDLNKIGELLRTGKYADVLHLMHSVFPRELPNGELAKIASFCEVKLGQPSKAIDRLLAEMEKSGSSNSLLISLCFAYATNNEIDKVEKRLLNDIDFSRLSLQEVNEIRYLINEFPFGAHTLSEVLCRLADNLNDEALLGQLLQIANQKHLYDCAYFLADKLYKYYPKNNYLIDKAIALRFLNRPDEGAQIIQKLVPKISHFAIHHNLGNMYSDMGRLNEALVEYEKAISLNPSYVDSLVNYARVAYELGQRDVWLAPIEKQLPLQPNNKAIQLAYINLLLENNAYGQANSHLETAGIAHTDPVYALLKAKCLRALQRPNDAMQLLLPFKAFSIKEISVELLEIALEIQDVDLAFELIKQIQNTKDVDASTIQITIANEYIARQLSNKPLRYAIESAVAQSICSQGEIDLDKVNAILMNHHKMRYSPVNQSVQKGTQTRGNLFPSRDKHLQSIERYIKQKVVDYVNNHKAILNLPAANNADIKHVRFTGSWSVLNKSDGYHVPHYHSKGLVSGVFYVDIPEELKHNSEAGHLHLGMVDKQPYYHIAPVLTVRPERGKLVLFPSHLWHGTYPTEITGERLTIAFDAVLA